MFQKTYTHFFLALALVLAGLTLAPGAFAAQDYWGKRTLITTNKPIEVPGKVLPAGRYIFEITGLVAERNVVRISKETGEVLAMVIGVPDKRREVSDKTLMTFYEAAPGSPQALRAWFYAGDNSGVEFVYPKKRAVEIAAKTQEHVIAENPPAAAAPAEPTVAKLLEEPIVAIAPSGREVPVEQRPQAAAPAPQAETPVVAAAPPPPAPALPKTATSLALIGLIGAVSTGAAIALRRYTR